MNTFVLSEELIYADAQRDLNLHRNDAKTSEERE
jgi:hypothetical protein